MAYTLSVPNEYGYVILAACSTFFLNTVQGIQTGNFRKTSKVPYPNAYATPEQAKENKEAYLFNCAQRSHANFTENHLSAVAPLLIAGLQFPLTSAVLGFGWTISRFLYMRGYVDAKVESGRGRYRGITFWLCQFGLLGLASWVGVTMALGK